MSTIQSPEGRLGTKRILATMHLCSFVPALKIDLPHMVGTRVKGPDDQVTVETKPSHKQWAAPLEAVLKYVAGDTGVTLPATNSISGWFWKGDYPDGAWKGHMARSPLLEELVPFVSSEAAAVRAKALGRGLAGRLLAWMGCKQGGWPWSTQRRSRSAQRLSQPDQTLPPLTPLLSHACCRRCRMQRHWRKRGRGCSRR